MTKFLNLDEVKSPVDVVIQIGGVEHALVEPTVADFIENMKELENLALTATPREEIEMSIRFIMRSFPTIEEATLRGLRLTQLRQIGDWIRGISGQDVAEVQEGEEGNPQTAS